MLYDLIIIGGGPAAISAAIYVARKKIKLLLITPSFGGQVMESFLVENYLGVDGLIGVDLTQKFVNHLKKFTDSIKEGEKVLKIETSGIGESKQFQISTAKNIYQAKTVIVATGNMPRPLNVPGAKEFTGKGVSYCATCDAPLYDGKIAAVVGAGDAGLDAAWQLTAYAAQIYILNRSAELKSDDVVLQEKIKNHPKIKILFESEIKEIQGDKFVQNLIYRQRGKEKELKLNGIFIEIGNIPASDCVKNLAKLNPKGEILIDPKTNSASEPGLFAAGDVTEIPHKQIIVAAGEGAKAALSAYEYLKSGLYNN